MSCATISKLALILIASLSSGLVSAAALDRTSWSLSASINEAGVSNAIDSSITTRWDSKATQRPGQYFQIDLGSQKTIDGLELSNQGSANDYPRGYQVFASNDANNFGVELASGAGAGTETVINFAPITARYVRITQTESNSSFWWSIHDLNVFESEIEVTEKLSRTAWTLSASNNNDNLGNAIDNDTNTRWTTRQIQTPGQYLQIDLGSSQEFNNLVLDSRGSPNDAPNLYSVYVSDDANNFGSVIATGVGDSSGITDIVFASVNARHVRIEQNGRTARNWWSIHDLNIFSTGGGSEPPGPPINPNRPTGDECNTTSQCQAIYGSIANNCANSQSSESLCMCGSQACYLSGGTDGGGTDGGGTDGGGTDGGGTDGGGTDGGGTDGGTDGGTTGGDDCVVSGDLEQWHRVELLCDGPAGSESDDNTFTDYRFDVTFSNGGRSLTIPGHFAADGNAADSNSASGNKWRAYFSPPTTGTWTYDVSFRSGNNIAVDTRSGSSVSSIDNTTGTFGVGQSSARGNDMRKRGLLTHDSNERYLRFADGSIFIEGGMGSPENIFGYSEFDNTTKQDNVSSCKGILHDFDPHEDDWNSGDPTWDGNKGRSLIGLVNYIASHGVNSAYIMMNTVSGDGCDAHPWSTYNSSGTVKSFDVSKLDQWERVLGHMTEKGIMIHSMTQETENDQLLNGGDLGNERKLYYRELISRFGHHPALQWNLGEENTNTTAQRKDYSDYIKQIDPYDHMIKMHTFPTGYDEYDGLLGHDTFDGATIQTSPIRDNESATGNGVYGIASEWLDNSEDAGRPWVVTFTEASGGDAPTPDDEVTSLQRIHWMWASTMSGGGGFAWYLKNSGSGHAYDLAVEDMREFDQHWEQSGYLTRFFRDIVQGGFGIDLQDLDQDNGVTSTSSDWVLSDPGNAYIVYLRDGGSTNINLPNNLSYNVLWFNPRTGQSTQGGTLVGPGNEGIGNPPSQSSSDWAVLITPES